MAFVSGGVMERGNVYTIKTSGAETANTTHNTVQTGPAGAVVLTVAVTAASGTTPTLSIVVEGSVDGSTWFTLGTIGTNYAVGSSVTAVTNFTAAATTLASFSATEYVRTRSVVGGTTPSFTYSVVAQTN